MRFITKGVFRILLMSVLLLFSACCARQDGAVIDDMAHARIGVLLGSSSDTYITKNYPDNKIVRLESTVDLLSAIKAGSCDVALASEGTAKVAVANDKEIKIIGESDHVSYLSVAFRKGENQLVSSFNDYLAEIKADGTLDDLISRWRTDNVAEVRIPDLGKEPEGEPIVLGTTGLVIPHSFIADNSYQGLDVELVLRFGRYIGRPVKIKSMNFSALIPSLKSGDVDIIANNIMVTEERAAQVSFSDAYIVEKNLLLSIRNADDDVAEYESLEDFRGGNIATISGYSCEEQLNNDFSDSNVMLIDTEADLIQALISGQADVILLDGHVIKYHLHNLDGVKILEEPYSVEDAGFAFNKDSGKELVESFNEFLSQLKSDGTYDEIYDKWINNAHSADMPDLPLIKEGTPLRVGTASTIPPMSFIQNGELCGFDIEMMTRFADFIGRPIEFTDMNFSALIPSLVSGHQDVVASCLNITPERAESVLFSDPYYLCPALIAYYDPDSVSSGSDTGIFEGIAMSFKRNVIDEDRYLLILDGLKVTALIALFAILMGTLLGAFICWMKMCRFKLLNGFADLYISIMRGMPVLVLLMIMFYVVFAGTGVQATFVAVLTFALNFAAYVSEMFRTSIESVDRGQTEAGIALGFTPLKTFVNIVLPQAFKQVLPVYKGEVISLVKMTSIVGYIAVQDLTKAGDIIRSRTFDAFFPLILVSVLYFILAWVFTLVLDQIGKKMIKG